LIAIASKSPREAISDADVVVTSVTLLPNLDPFLDAWWLKPGAFVTSIDLALPWLPEGRGVFQRIVIDDLETIVTRFAANTAGRYRADPERELAQRRGY
jgi:ornithine cyclodeaminase/alanine dehydrogenase-like protein (mu-crystallin family)